ncbi:autotransporter assembly complex family protein [Neomegalonema sp.]|uniref:autotransporter assembly complex protein TamA n=1 Tax=Neomegalonema sp. TaxID=2039713 RepID=UPI002622937D|nr:BamA/TamA family outer membrane protein [Neomegalonema sp.]MDD2869595.1 BamA/TamA family outer membrane protein [Neomegalonema sp.]
MTFRRTFRQAGLACALGALTAGCASFMDLGSPAPRDLQDPALGAVPATDQGAAATDPALLAASLSAAEAAAASPLVDASAPEQPQGFRSILGRVTSWFTGEEERPLMNLPRLSATEGVLYEIEVKGLEEGDSAENARITGLIEAATRLYRMQDRPPASLPLLRRRAEADKEIIERILKSEGYYKGRAEVKIYADGRAPDEAAAPQTAYDLLLERERERAEAEKPAPDLRPLAVIEVEKGPLFLIEKHEFAFTPPPSEAEILWAMEEAEAQRHVGGPARGAEVASAESRLVGTFQNSGNPWAKQSGRAAEADWDDDRLRVETEIATGPYAAYGETTVSGLTSVQPDYVLQFPTWAEGHPVSRAEIAEVSRDLTASRLFKAVSLRIAEEPPEAAYVVAPVHIEVEEAPHRTIGGGLKYSTVDGPGARVFWQHRNMFGRGEQFGVTLDGSLNKQSLDLGFRKPRFHHRNRDLTAELEIYHEDTDAYEAFAAEGGIGVAQILGEHWRGAAGLAFEVARVERPGEEHEWSYLLGAPVSLSFDNTDDLLDPTRGFRLGLAATPWGGVYKGDATAFLSTDATASAYYAIDEDGRFVLAGRLRGAAIFADGPDKVPPTRQLYMGGGGSLRGYSLKFANPLDGNGDPVGGLTLGEAALELRAKVTESIGVVPFVEAGIVGRELFSEFDDVRFSAGLGLRYYTAIGPIRLDVAVPIDPRPQDDRYQLYFSIGQAF